MKQTFPKWIGLLANQLGIETDHAKGYYTHDFQENDKPDFNTLKSHILYQERLMEIGNACGWDEYQFADAWCQEF